MPQLMTQASFARHRGVSKGCVTNWKNSGLLVLAEGPTGKPMVDVVRTDLKLNANIDPMRGRPSTGGMAAAAEPPGGGDAPALPLGGTLAVDAPAPTGARDELATARLEESRERRIGIALKNARDAGELVPLAEAERRVSEVGRAARERMHAWARGIAERVAAEKDIRQIMAIFEAGIDDVFGQLADAADAGEFAGDADADLTPEETAEMEAVALSEDAVE